MQTQTNYQTLCSLALLLSIVIGCKQSSSTDVIPPDPTCQAQTVNAVSVESGTTFTTGTAFNYDGKGQLTSAVTSNSGTSGAGGRTTQTYTYDNDGYQTAYKSVYAYTGQGDETYNYTYEYANGRLTKQTTQSTSDYVESTGTATYTYDAAGVLTQSLGAYNFKFGKITSATSYTTSFANGVLTAEKSIVDGKATTTTYTVENGRITTETRSDGTKTRYTYDAGGYQTKSEALNTGGIVTSSTTTEYGTTQAPKSLYPAQKGRPVNKPYYGNNDRAVTRVTTTSNGKLFSDYQYQYQLNSKGYPTKLVRTNVLTNTLQTTTYAYVNCQ